MCQENERDHLRLFSSDDMDATIRYLDEYDYKLHVRVNGVSHLSAAEAKYHRNCIMRAVKNLKIQHGVESGSGRKVTYGTLKVVVL